MRPWLMNGALPGLRSHTRLVFNELMTLPRSCLSILRHRPIFRELARTYYHASESGFRAFRNDRTRRQRDLYYQAIRERLPWNGEGRFRGRRVDFPGPKGICSTVVCCDWLRRASRGLYPPFPLLPVLGRFARKENPGW